MWKNFCKTVKLRPTLCLLYSLLKIDKTPLAIAIVIAITIAIAIVIAIKFELVIDDNTQIFFWINLRSAEVQSLRIIHIANQFGFDPAQM